MFIDSKTVGNMRVFFKQFHEYFIEDIAGKNVPRLEKLRPGENKL